MTDRLQQMKRRLWLAGLVVLLSGLPAQAKKSDEMPLFVNQTTLNVRIEGPLSTLMRKRSNTEYLEGKLSYVDTAGTTHEMDLKFRARGNFRRRKGTCHFPPMRLNFKKNQVHDTEFSGQNILKLVTHCKSSGSRYERYVVKEYLAYKLLQLHTPYSFRVRLMKITWVDTDKNNKTSEKYGFVIEHKNTAAERLDVKVVDFVSTRHDKINHEQASIASVFQYLIGNTDFSLVKGTIDSTCCHNAVLVAPENSKFIPVLYDFDFSGLVDASYAGPNPKFRIKSVTQRLYRGHCSVNSELADTIALFQEKMPSVLDLIEHQEGLTPRDRKRTRVFINKFYTELASPNRIERKFSKACFH